MTEKHLFVKKYFHASVDTVFNQIMNGRLFELTGADNVEFDLFRGGNFRCVFNERGSISGCFKTTVKTEQIELSWNVIGFGRPDEQTEVTLHLENVDHSTCLTVEHKKISSSESFVAKGKAWVSVLENFADEIEIDVSSIEHNLELSFEDRIIEHQRALDLVIQLRHAGEVYYGQPI